ncbi:MAG TPA: lysylphosphatidylglycerol synthase transmembrane domain-containing protein [Vicinamibacterales bacterium]
MALWQTIVSSVAKLGTARPVYILAALGLYIVSLFMVGARWRGFLCAVGGRVSVLRATLATLGGISVNNLTPSSRVGGEVCRIALVRAAGATTWQQATIAAVWDRLSEVPPISVLAVMSLVAVRDLSSRSRTLAIAFVIVFVLALAILGLRQLRKARGWLAGWRERLALDRITLGVFATGVGYSSLLWLQDVLRLLCVALAFGVVLTPTQVAALSILTMLGGLVPTVGGLGAVEGGLVAGLLAFGVDGPTAAAVTAAERAISYGFGTAAGAVVVALLGGRSLWTASRSRRTSGAFPP